jgi:PPOX class probable F420-dependent enzyme
MGFKHASFLDVAEGLQPNQFTIGDRSLLDSLDELPTEYRQLLDEPVTSIVAITGSDGRPNLSPVWFGYEGDKVLLNFAEHRKKTGWLRATPHVTVMLMNPANPYHWLSIKATVTNEIHEDGPEGARATETIDAMWTKYTGNAAPYGLRDPSFDERRVLFECTVDSVATFGRP